MPKLYEVLAAEATAISAEDALSKETLNKFQKADLFQGLITNLNMISDDPAAQAIAREGSTVKAVSTSVTQTLDYCLKVWANAENVRATKNATNQIAMADVIVGETVLLTDVPVDELMGLEARVGKLRALFTQAPSRDASKVWTTSTRFPVEGLAEAAPVVSTKTEEQVYPMVMSPATDKHPAQVKEAKRTVTVGSFERIALTSALTTNQKAALLAACDTLTVALRQARNRANAVEVIEMKAGDVIHKFFMEALTSNP